MPTKDFYILVIRSGITYDTADDLEKTADYFLRKQGLTVHYDFIDTDLPDLTFKDFGVFAVGDKTYWGLDGIKQKLRDLKLVKPHEYDAVVFLYELEKGYDFNARPLGAWTYPNDLNGAAFCEIPSRKEWAKKDDIHRMMTHELLHCQHRLCWWNKRWTNDTLDLYDKEYEVEALDGNRQRNINAIAPYLNVLIVPPQAKIIRTLISLYQQLLAMLPKDPVNKVKEWAKAIQAREGFFDGSRSERNHNPGNLRTNDSDRELDGIQPTQYLRSLGAIGADPSGFCIFSTYEDGLNGLQQFLRDAANRQLIPYRDFNAGIPYHLKLLPNGSRGDKLPELTLIDFCNIYAPAEDDNDPNSYAVFVAQQLGVDPKTKIKELI